MVTVHIPYTSFPLLHVWSINVLVMQVVLALAKVDSVVEVNIVDTCPPFSKHASDDCSYTILSVVT